MAKSAGKIMPIPKGAYDENTTYNILDMVTLDNKLWIAKKSGIVGVTPSATATEWMMAVDGTTDVKGLESEVDAKFEEYDTKFNSIDNSVNANGTGISTNRQLINVLENRCDELENKQVEITVDSEPTKDSTNPISSAGVYNALHYYEEESSGMEKTNAKLLVGYNWAGAYRANEQNVGGMHRKSVTYVNAGNMYATMYASQTPGSSDTLGVVDQNTTLEVQSGAMRLTIEDANPNTRNSSSDLYFTVDYFCSNESGTYDLGGASYKFKNIYATTGTIQTSDANEKKDIADMDAALASNIIMGLRPVTYKYIDGTSDRTHHGLIAQEVETLINSLGIDNQDFAALTKTQKQDEEKRAIDGEYIYGLRYTEFVGILIKMCQNLQNEINDLRTELDMLKQ